MKFLSLFFRFLGAVVIIFLFTLVVGREIWLFLGAQEVARQAQRLTQVARWQPYYSNCRAELALGSDIPFRGIQVRFIDQETFVSEIDCIGQNPFEIDRFTLPMGVKKTTGSAGFFFDPMTQVLSGEVTISFLGQSRVVYTESQKISQQWGQSIVRSELPVSQCSGHGLKCCDALEFQGEGLPMSGGVLDCPGGCFDSCLRRPVLLSFQSDPSLSQTRVLELVGQNQFVTFAYTFDLQESELESVIIDYGDGTQDTGLSPTGQFEKEFSCPGTSVCSFTVTLQATDARGVVSAPTRLSTLQVSLNPVLFE